MSDNSCKNPIAKIDTAELAELRNLFYVAMGSSQLDGRGEDSEIKEYVDNMNLLTFYDGLGDKYHFDPRYAKINTVNGEVCINGEQ